MAKTKAKAKPKADDVEDAGPKTANDAWTGMLVISFLALSIGTAVNGTTWLATIRSAPQAWWAISTKAGGEIISSDAY